MEHQRENRSQCPGTRWKAPKGVIKTSFVVARRDMGMTWIVHKPVQTTRPLVWAREGACCSGLAG